LIVNLPLRYNPLVANTEPTPDDKLKQMLTFGTKLFAVPKAEYDALEAKRKKRSKQPRKKP
jgi:hypothetical protein